MVISERGLSLLKQSEGFSATLYICPAGKNTIGYGHVILSGEEYAIDGISEEVAENILIQDVSIAQQAIDRLVTVALNQNQFDALAVFIYNIGSVAFENSTLLRLLNKNDMQGAAAQFGRWIYAGGVILAGLVTRRAAETALFSAEISGVD